MIARTSKEVTKRQKVCNYLLIALEDQGPRISDLLLEQARPFLQEGDAEPSAAAMQVSLSRRLTVHMENLVEADEDLYRANAHLAELYQDRNAAAGRVRQQVIRLRKIVVGQYLAPQLDGLGLGTSTSRSPVVLLRQADRIAAVFGGEQLVPLLGEPMAPEQGVPQSAAVRVGEHAEDLRALLRRIDRALRARDEVLVAKRRHMAAHDLAYVHTARTFEAFCRLAGEGELADRVRRSEARRKKASEEEEGSTQEPQEPQVPEEPTSLVLATTASG